MHIHNKHGIRRNFARRAATYDAHAQVQRFMADELLRHSAAEVRRAARILEIGCGTGYLTAALRRLNPQAWLAAVDLDVRLIQAARVKLNGAGRTAWLVADGETLVRGGFDLIISNSTFQWFSQPGETLRGYLRCLSPRGSLAFAALGPWTFRELAASLKEASREINPSNPPEIAAARFLGEGDWQRLLRGAGFNQVRAKREVLEASFPAVKDFLASLRATGATNPAPRPFSPRLLKAMMAAYHTGFGQNGGIPASYEVIWVSARKTG
jgi:malonyl-CoA O-methyltransferase